MKKIFFSETTRPKACIFSMQQCFMMLYIDTANDDPGVQNGPTPGDISSHILTMGKASKNLHVRNQLSPGAFTFCV